MSGKAPGAAPDGADRRALLRAAAGTLPGPTPLLDAELLLAHALGEERLEMLLKADPVPHEARVRFEALVARRRAHEPVAYITGTKEFWSLPLAVTPAVLIPRPDSETLVEAAREALADAAPAEVLDLGTGSGALLLAALSLWPEARGLGIDCSADALAVARANALRLGFAPRADFRVGNWGEGLAGPFDLVLANPPYVAEGADLPPDVAGHEPASALFAGPDGLDAIRRILPDLPRLLAPSGVAVLELDPGQVEAATALAAAAGLAAEMRSDLAGRPRALLLRPHRTRFGLGNAPLTR